MRLLQSCLTRSVKIVPLFSVISSDCVPNSFQVTTYLVTDNRTEAGLVLIQNRNLRTSILYLQASAALPALTANQELEVSVNKLISAPLLISQGDITTKTLI